jgi:hypothetical protein
MEIAAFTRYERQRQIQRYRGPELQRYRDTERRRDRERNEEREERELGKVTCFLRVLQLHATQPISSGVLGYLCNKVPYTHLSLFEATPDHIVALSTCTTLRDLQLTKCCFGDDDDDGRSVKEFVRPWVPVKCKIRVVSVKLYNAVKQ